MGGEGGGGEGASLQISYCRCSARGQASRTIISSCAVSTVVAAIASPPQQHPPLPSSSARPSSRAARGSGHLASGPAMPAWAMASSAPCMLMVMADAAPSDSSHAAVATCLEPLIREMLSGA